MGGIGSIPPEIVAILGTAGYWLISLVKRPFQKPPDWQGFAIQLATGALFILGAFAAPSQVGLETWEQRLLAGLVAAATGTILFKLDKASNASGGPGGGANGV